MVVSIARIVCSRQDCSILYNMCLQISKRFLYICRLSRTSASGTIARSTAVQYWDTRVRASMSLVENSSLQNTKAGKSSKSTSILYSYPSAQDIHAFSIIVIQSNLEDLRHMLNLIFSRLVLVLDSHVFMI